MYKKKTNPCLPVLWFVGSLLPCSSNCKDNDPKKEHQPNKGTANLASVDLGFDVENLAEEYDQTVTITSPINEVASSTTNLPSSTSKSAIQLPSNSTVPPVPPLLNTPPRSPSPEGKEDGLDESSLFNHLDHREFIDEEK